MRIRQFDIWIADLSTTVGTESVKTRPVVVIQTDLLNDEHPSTIICPITSNVKEEIQILRIHLNKGQLKKQSDVLIDQIRAIDNRRLIKKVSSLSKDQEKKIIENLKIVLDL